MATVYNQGRTAKPRNPFYQTGKQLQMVHSRLRVDVATNANGDVFVLAEGISAADRVHRIRAGNASGTLTAANDNDIGFYKYKADGTLVAVSKDKLVDGADYSGGITAGTDLLAGMSDTDAVKSVGELLGVGVDAEPIGGYVLAMTMNTKATTTSRTLDFDVLIEKATRL